MRFITASFATAMFLLVCFSPVKTFAAQQYVEISEPFVNVYEFLDPKSTVLSMVKKNDRLELIYAGTTWYQVKIGTKQGWVERKAGHVVDGPSFLSPAISIVLVLIVLAGTMYGVSFYMKKQKKG
jgi:hypothetical protein